MAESFVNRVMDGDDIKHHRTLLAAESEAKKQANVTDENVKIYSVDEVDVRPAIDAVKMGKGTLVRVVSPVASEELLKRQQSRLWDKASAGDKRSLNQILDAIEW